VDVVRTAGALDEVRRRMMTHVGVAVTSERMLCEALRVLTGPRHWACRSASGTTPCCN